MYICVHNYVAIKQDDECENVVCVTIGEGCV